MATWPAKINYATGDVLTAAQMNDIGGELNDLYTSSGFVAGKNKILNGDFGIWQRGTSFSNAADGTYLADRFFANQSNNNYSQQTFTPGTAPVVGYEGSYFLRGSVTGTGSTAIGMGQKIEDVRTLAGQTATFSFWAKADSARTLTLYMAQSFGTGGSATVVITNSTTFALTTSWQRFSYVATVPSISGKTIGTNSNLFIITYLAAGQASGSVALDTWGWQLEAGSIATPFQTATGTKQGELAACQRYYVRYGFPQVTNVGAILSTGRSYSTTNGDAYFLNPSTLRTVATSVDYSTLKFNDQNNTSYSITNVVLSTANALQTSAITFTSSGMTASRMGWIAQDGSANGYIGFSAEL